MTSHIAASGVHYMTLTVTDVERSVAFYTDLLGFQHAADFGQRELLRNGSLILAIGPPPANTSWPSEIQTTSSLS